MQTISPSQSSPSAGRNMYLEGFSEHVITWCVLPSVVAIRYGQMKITLPLAFRKSSLTVRVTRAEESSPVQPAWGREKRPLGDEAHPRGNGTPCAARDKGRQNSGKEKWDNEITVYPKVNEGK